MTWIVLLALAQSATEPAAVARRVAEAQPPEPWLWSDSARDLMFVFETRTKRRMLNAAGREVKPRRGDSVLSRWRSLRLEHTPLWWYPRCLEFDGRRPCPEDGAQEFRRKYERRPSLSAVERAQLQQEHRVRLADRAAWWQRFPATHRFELRAPDRLRFTGEWTGELTFDPKTFQIRALAYQTANGNSFRCETFLLPSGERVPRRTEQRSKSEHRSTSFMNYRPLVELRPDMAAQRSAGAERLVASLLFFEGDL